MALDTQLFRAIGDNEIVKEQLQRAKQSLEAEPAPSAASDAAPAAAAAGDGAVDKKAQARAKKADDYHARHRSWVAEFNELTGGECAGGEGGVKWAAVRAWQQKHWQLNNLLADGLVGPKTLEAAKLLQKKNPPKKEGADEKEAGGEKEHAAPGQADGAEASADKPNLEGDVDEQIAPAHGAPPTATPGKKQTTLAEFDAASSKLEKLLTQFKPPKGAGGDKPIAQHYVEGTDDAEAPPALGAMMKTEVLQGYEAAAKQLATSWDRTPIARARFLLDAVNDALATEKVPAIFDVHLAKMSNPGEFVPRDWVMKMNEEVFGASAPRNVLDAASKVFHEGRHAEQRFTVARLVATQKPHYTVQKIAKAADVPIQVATKACDLRTEPLSPAQQEKAQEFKQATVDNPAHKDIEHMSEAITDAANHAAAAFHALSPTDQATASARWQELRQQAIAGLEAYYHLATERDAYAAQKQLADANK